MTQLGGPRDVGEEDGHGPSGATRLGRLQGGAAGVTEPGTFAVLGSARRTGGHTRRSVVRADPPGSTAAGHNGIRQEDEALVVVDALEGQSVGTEASREER